MAARLRAHVWVHQDSGEPVQFGPDDDVPAWAAEKITNPRAWEPDDEPEAEPAKQAIVTENATPTPVSGPFDPSAHGVDDVLEYLTSLGDSDEAKAEYDRVIAAERDGKARKTILA